LLLNKRDDGRMYQTTVRIERPEGTVIATGLTAQAELIDSLPHQDAGGNRDYLYWDVLLTDVPTVGVQPRDVLQDEQNTDPLTGTGVRWVVATAEVFTADHVEARCQQIIGQ